jgi:hypothetical protein
MVVVLTLVFSLSASAAEISYSVNGKGKWERLVDGTPVGTPYSGPAEQEDGLEIYGTGTFFNGMDVSDSDIIYWLIVLPENNAEKEGEAGPVGIHFYDENNSRYYFVPQDEDFTFQSLDFDPDLNKVIVNMASSFMVLAYPKMETLVGFQSSTRAIWLDEDKFIFGEDDPEYDGTAYPGTSVVVLNPVTKEKLILKQATETSIFLPGFWSPGEITGQENDPVHGDNIMITEISVKSPADWEDYPDKAQAKIITVPRP